MMSDDMALVREYAQSNSEQAFATLVSRYVNLVYSVALRRGREPHLAEEITQAVFIILARKAKRLSPETILSGWLCRTARYVSAHTLRDQRRRQFRERESQMQSTLNEPESGVWDQIAPLLDEALNRLGEKEHDAIVLRFLDGKELRQVGEAMGTTEDAARMRVNRGLEKLRKFFTNKGLTLSTTSIARAVGAHSIQAAPAELAATITVAALSGTTITTAALVSAAKTLSMTTLQKAIVATSVALLAAGGIYEARQAAKLSGQVQRLQGLQAPLAEQIQQLQHERDTTANQLAGLQGENDRLKSGGAELLRLRSQVNLLRRQVAQSNSVRPNRPAPNARQEFEEKPTEILTRDNRKLIMSVHLSWRVSDTNAFASKFPGASIADAQAQLENVLRKAETAVVGLHNLSDFENTNPGDLQMTEVEKQIQATLEDCLTRDNCGISIESVTVGIS
jgi:RNA polymerase sigma factor (sigma-70 family)